VAKPVVIDGQGNYVELPTAEPLETNRPDSVPAGGAVGQVLTKSTASDYAAEWQTPANGSVSYSKLLSIASLRV
jgi:hypothetical protein